MKKILLGIFLIFLPALSLAEDFSSTNFNVENPTLSPAGLGTSSSFKLYGVVSETAIGESSATNYGVNAGFLYFPFASAPVVSGTAGDASASLSWTASSGFLGWTISSYSVGQATSSGGPYSYTNVGNVTSTSISSLSNGTTYYFVVRAKDFFGNFVATSSEVSLTPTGSSGNNNSGGGGGGGGIIGYFPSLNLPLDDLDECQEFADLNCDGRVDLIDFSIMYYWFDKPSPPIRVDLHKDGKIDIYDFSVMAYYWTERI